MSDDDQKLRVRRVGRDGRRRYDPGSKERLIASCFQPGVSISGLALAHGINANLLRKWVKDAREAGCSAVSSQSPFIPVVAADCRLPVANSEDQPTLLAKTARPSVSSKIRALLPNGVKLTLECSDVDALTAIIRALAHVQTGR